jgi:hypothetical protein
LEANHGKETAHGNLKPGCDYENEAGWMLFYDDGPPSRWVVARDGTITEGRNETLTLGQPDEAKAWADEVFAEYLKKHPRPFDDFLKRQP